MEGQSDRSLHITMATRGILVVAVPAALLGVASGIVNESVALVVAFALLGALVVVFLVQNLRATRDQ